MHAPPPPPARAHHRYRLSRRRARARAAWASLYCMEVVFRYFLNAPTRWSLEVITYLMLIVTFLAIPHAVRAGMHIAVTLLADLYPRHASAHPVRDERRSASRCVRSSPTSASARTSPSTQGSIETIGNIPYSRSGGCRRSSPTASPIRRSGTCGCCSTATSRSSRMLSLAAARRARGRCHEPAHDPGLGLAVLVGLFLSGLAGLPLLHPARSAARVIVLFGAGRLRHDRQQHVSR